MNFNSSSSSAALVLIAVLAVVCHLSLATTSSALVFPAPSSESGQSMHTYDYAQWEDLLIFASQDDEDDYYYRYEHGAKNVVKMHKLIEGFESGRISEGHFLLELWEGHDELTTALFDEYGAITPQFLIDLVTAQSNGIMGENPQDGTLVFIDAARFLGDGGTPVPGSAREFNLHIQANSILNDLVATWETLDDVDPNNPWLSNRCCNTSATPENCDTVTTNGRCKMPDPDFGMCQHGSTKCTDQPAD